MSELTDKAQTMLANRIEVIGQLEESAAELDRSKQLVRDAEASMSTAWENAISAGWTKAELRQLQLTPPAARRSSSRGKARRHPRAAAAPSASTTSSASDPSVAHE